MRWVRVALLTALPCAPVQAAELLDCVTQAVCEAGGECVANAIDFSLEPEGEGYVTRIDAGEFHLTRVSPPGAAMASYIAKTEAPIAGLLSVFPDGRFTFTTQQDIDGPHVETTFGRCVPGA